MRVLPLVLFALCAVPAAAQQPTPREALGQVLTKARDSRALERVLGLRHLRMGDSGQTALVTLEGTLLDDGQAVRLAVSIDGVEGRMRGEGIAMAFTYGFDGALRRYELSRRDGDRSQRVEGRVEDGALVMSDDRRSEWNDQAMPIQVAVFFLACLADQGLPERLVAEPFEGDDGHLERVTTTIETRRDEADGWAITFHGVRPFTKTASARADARGGLVEVVFGGKLRFAPIDATEAERLKELIAR
jgi:hypothetical protein